MTKPAMLTVVLPVRDGQHTIATEVERVLEAISDLATEKFEVIVVDDASRDATPEILDELTARFPQLRVVRHRRALGMELAGQTGLERAKGELVFIQEDDSPLRMEDLRQLYQMGRDHSVVAARAQSTARSTNGPLLRRLKAWGARAACAAEQEATAADLQPSVRGLQMVRRPHLQLLASRGGDQVKLETERITAERVENVSRRSALITN
jgi:glycosyltransferase involved in cell wall biosynthesis